MTSMCEWIAVASPGHALSGIGGIGPDDGDLGVHQAESEEDFLGRVAVGHVGWGDHDQQRQSARAGMYESLLPVNGRRTRPKPDCGQRVAQRKPCWPS